MHTFTGAWPALVTPFTADNQVNIPTLKRLTDHLIGQGSAGLYLCGSTGQGIHLSVAERKLVLETVYEQTQGRIPLIVHVGGQVTGNAVQLAAHAAEVGAAGISSIIPAGYSTLDSIRRYYAVVAAAAPLLPFLPYVFGATTDAVALIRALDGIPNLGGTKYTGPNMFEFRQVVEARSGVWSVFSGMDEQCLFAAMFGSCGNIGSTLNVMPGIYRRIHDGYQAGDLLTARDLQLRANRVTEVMMSFGFMSALYAALALLGFDCGQPRLPVLPFPDAQRAALKTALEAVDYFEIAAM